jgi:hypothetical protein
LSTNWQRKPYRVEHWEGCLEHSPLLHRLELYLRANIDGRRASILVSSPLLRDKVRAAVVGEPWTWLIGSATVLGWKIEYDRDADTYRIESRQPTICALTTIEFCLRKTEGAAMELVQLKTREKMT